MNKYMIVAGGALLGVSFAAFAADECSQVTDNLVKNCGFETGCFADWAATYTTVVDAGEIAHSGEFGVQFLARDTVAWIGQGLSTTAGQAYTVSFWLRNVQASNHLELWWDDVLIYDAADLPATPYQQVVIEGVVASSDSAMFWLGITNPNGDVYVDDVVVVPQ